MTSPKKTNEKNISEAYLEPSQTSKTEFIRKITIFTMCSILTFALSSEYVLHLTLWRVSIWRVILSQSDRNLKSTFIF